MKEKATPADREADSYPGNRSHLADRMKRIEPFHVVEVMERAWEAERSGRRIVRFIVGEPDFGTPQRVVEAATRAIASGDVHYTPSLGIEELREAISGYYETRYSAHVPSDRIVVTTGASAALLMAFGATIDPDDSVLMCDPGYPCNQSLLEICGGATARIAVGPDENYQLNAALVSKAWDSTTRGVLVGSPSNPTGAIVKEAELEKIIELARASDGLCFVDEVYGELVYGRRPSTALMHADDIFVVNSFSKTFGMTGWRLGWLVCPVWALESVRTLAQNIYISPPMPAQAGAVAAFSDEVFDIVEQRRVEFEARRNVMVAGLREIGFGVPILPEGGFYVYAQCDAFSHDSADLARALLDGAGVAVAPGHDFGNHESDRHLRFSYTTSLTEINEGLERIATFLAR